MFASLYVPYPLENPYTYKIPSGIDLKVGMRVQVNFAGRVVIGFVVYILENFSAEYKIKDIISVIDEEPIFDAEFIDLVMYVSKTYISSPGEVFSLALPSGVRASDRHHKKNEIEKEPQKDLNDEQTSVVNNIITESAEDKLFHLIFGITGSGKTEVYISLALHYMAQGKSVIFCVPEISLSSQIYQRLEGVFGDDLIIYHSGLTQNQRLYNWHRFQKGDAKIVIGTRSSVFMKAPDLGLVIIDEEHDGSYKENSSPRYNAKNVAYYRCRKEKATLVLGSATPSVESLFGAEKGFLILHRLTKRFGTAEQPVIELVEIDGKSGTGVSPTLKLMTNRAIENKKQAIYLLNRRGFAPFVICDDCSHVVECPHCSISLNSHNDGNLHCHYCGYVQPYPLKCPECNGENLTQVGAGTQRVEETIQNEFPNYRIFRLDQDTSRKKGTAKNLLDEMKNGNVDVLLGTQMVAKGFDFPEVTIVGVLMADIGMNLPDFRATERIFSLLMQVAGRSGRNLSKGKVIIQTLNAENEIFTYLKSHDYEGFYKKELEMRKMLRYPPFSRLARLLIRGKDEAKVKNEIESLYKRINHAMRSMKLSVEILGPSTAPFSKIASNYRYHIILKGDNSDELRGVINAAKKQMDKGLYLEIDIDPVDLL
ncbi:MAG: primosomal protein N' [Bacteroidales bacterium]|jgi:primosomal protein N' (replication factor Y)|nr:primosomal protein N' [Bacteroidales bacterium]